MTEAISFPGDTAVSIKTAHGSLRGLLTLPAHFSALVLLTHAGANPEARDDALSVVLGHAGMATLTLDLLTHAEERFADIHHNVSLLARRLLDGLTLIKQRMLLGELPTVPIGLCAAGDCSPVALRVAALRDNDIFAVVCRGGLIDMAGMLYLHSLTAPLLVLVGEPDEAVAASNQRALRELACDKELRLLPASAGARDSAAAFEFQARETAHWFVHHLPAPAASVSAREALP